MAGSWDTSCNLWDTRSDASVLQLRQEPQWCQLSAVCFSLKSQTMCMKWIIWPCLLVCLHLDSSHGTNWDCGMQLNIGFKPELLVEGGMILIFSSSSSPRALVGTCPSICSQTNLIRIAVGENCERCPSSMCLSSEPDHSSCQLLFKREENLHQKLYVAWNVRLVLNV